MSLITLEQLGAICTTAGGTERAAGFVEALNKWLAHFSINTPPRIACFIAQVMHETGELAHMRENTDYSRAAGLRATFPREFPTDLVAMQYVGHPMAIANRAYANRNGNGDEASGDGFRYRGGGCIQTTGKANYARAGQALGIDLLNHPDLIEAPDAAVGTACLFWNDHGLNAHADAHDFAGITKIINGPACAGMEDRLIYLGRAEKALEVG